MPLLRITLPFYLPRPLYHALRRVKRALFVRDQPRLSLWGDREVEWSFVAAHLPQGPGEALDFGNGGSYISLIAARRGSRVLALDLEAQSFPWRHPDVQFLQSDLFAAPLSGDHFDVIINCSAVEHVGLAGRYGVVEQRVDGDSEAMTRLRALMKPGGAMLLTIPVGQDAVSPPLCRVYGERRLPLLLQNYSVEHEEFWVKDRENRWVPCNRDVALRFKASAGSWDPSKNVYALGCFLLRRPG